MKPELWGKGGCANGDVHNGGDRGRKDCVSVGAIWW